MHKLNKIAVALVGATASALPALADDPVTNPLAAVETKMTEYIGVAQTSLVTILTAGAVIVGGFFIWGIVKKALNKSK